MKKNLIHGLTQELEELRKNKSEAEEKEIILKSTLEEVKINIKAPKINGDQDWMKLTDQIELLKFQIENMQIEKKQSCTN